MMEEGLEEGYEANEKIILQNLTEYENEFYNSSMFVEMINEVRLSSAERTMLYLILD